MGDPILFIFVILLLPFCLFLFCCSIRCTVGVSILYLILSVLEPLRCVAVRFCIAVGGVLGALPFAPRLSTCCSHSVSQICRCLPCCRCRVDCCRRLLFIYAVLLLLPFWLYAALPACRVLLYLLLPPFDLW